MPTNDPHWYPAGWQQPDDPVPLRGQRVSLEGGPLDGRSAHLLDDRFALWVAKDDAQGDLIVRSSELPPTLPPHCRFLGCYRYAAADEVLLWHGLSD